MENKEEDQNEIEFYTTAEIAQKFRIKSGTINRGLCVKGHYLGLTPIRLGNHRLLWSAKAVDAILSQAMKAERP